MIPEDRGGGGWGYQVVNISPKRARVRHHSHTNDKIIFSASAGDLQRQRKKRHRNHSVHREERRVQLAQIVVAHQRVFIEQERSHGNHPQPSRASLTRKPRSSRPAPEQPLRRIASSRDNSASDFFKL